MIGIILLALAALGTGKALSGGDDIPSEPTRHDVTERTTVLTHYPSGRVEEY